jgi:FKBP-type peptidyl-prolyl cis-trans isomerase FklB
MKFSKIPAIFGLAALLIGNSAGAAGLTTDKEKFSYAVGFQIAQGLKRDNLPVDPAALTLAIQDILSGKQPQVSPADMQAAVMAFQQAQQAERTAMADKNLKAGESFLTENRKKEGVTQTASGLQYKVLKSANGKKPTAQSTVVAHYRGSLINGKVFDNSYDRGEPASFPVSGVIKGWQEILPLMSVGSKYQIFIPTALAYGPQGAGADIGPNEALIFEIELLEIK